MTVDVGQLVPWMIVLPAILGVLVWTVWSEGDPH